MTGHDDIVERCPFCGGKAQVEHRRDHDDDSEYVGACLECDAHGQAYGTPGDAMDSFCDPPAHKARVMASAKVCGACEGTGQEPGVNKIVDCPTCHGRGVTFAAMDAPLTPPAAAAGAPPEAQGG